MPRELTIERRYVQGIELRTEDAEKMPVIHGYGAVFNKPSNLIAKSFYEVVGPTYFNEIIESPALDIRCLDNHASTIRYARFCPAKEIRTLSAEIDDYGLKLRVRPLNTQAGRDLIEEIRAGNIDAFSIGHYVADYEIRGTINGYPVRYLIRCANIDDISFATYPAYPDTASAELRTLYGITDEAAYAKQILENGNSSNLFLHKTILAEIDLQG